MILFQNHFLTILLDINMKDTLSLAIVRIISEPRISTTISQSFSIELTACGFPRSDIIEHKIGVHEVGH